MFPPHLPSLTFFPHRYRPHGIGNWSGHIPFARDLIAAQHPSILVELGTHLGESYFAFCQAIAENGTSCVAYAVDTWHGDPHTGTYGEEVFREVDAHNRERYGAFSRLLRMPFDEAAGRFEPGSIDLLHIDGLHTYDAVRHDFDTWWPKVRPGGVVLLHDVAMRHADFGVWRLWDELRQSYPTVEFPHSCGLGVVSKPGAAPDSSLAALLFGNDDAALDSLRRYYELCAERLEYRSLLNRQQHPADWSITTQLFWRRAGEPFSQAASIGVAHTVSPQRSRVAVSLPALPSPPAELRLDLTDRPAFLLLHTISACDPRGQILWTLDAGSCPDALAPHGMHSLATDAEGLLVSGTSVDSSLLLPLEASALDRLAGGGEITVEVSGLDPWSYAARLAEAAARRRVDDEAKLCRTSTALAHAQLLVTERDDQVQHYAAALADAQRIVKEQGAELRRTVDALEQAQRLVTERDDQLQRYAAALADAQRIVKEQGAELRRTIDALEQAQRLVTERDDQVQHYAAALADAQRIASEQSTQLRSYVVAFDHAQSLALERHQQLETYTRALADAQALAESRGDEIAAREADLCHLTTEIARVHDALARRERSLADLARRLAVIENSLAWRLVRPLTGIHPPAKDDPATQD